MKKTGVGVIGTGFARRVQIPAFAERDDVRLVSLASARIENAKSVGEKFGFEHVTDDWRETVSHPDVDLVCITTPPLTHREMYTTTLEAGKHLIAEKPMAMSLSEANEMAEVARKHPQLLAIIDHELRFQDGRIKAREMIRNGEIGKIRHARCTFKAPHRGDPNLEWTWWSDESQGGGALGAIGSHSIDTLHWLLDAEVSSVFCQLQTHIKVRKDSSGEERPVTSDDEANLILRFHEGDLVDDASATISVSMTEYPEYMNRTEIFGESGSLRIDALGELWIGRPDSPDWHPIDVDLGRALLGVPETGFSRAFVTMLPYVFEAIQSGNTKIDLVASFDDGVRTQKVLDAARESAAKKMVITL
jgi:predicted dehydrogenase